MHLQDPVCETCDRLQRRFGPLALGCVAGARDHRDLDRAIAFVLRNLDLADRAVLIVLTLHDLDRHPEIGERVGDVPGAECRIEPGVVPSMEGDVHVLVPARQSATTGTPVAAASRSGKSPHSAAEPRPSCSSTIAGGKSIAPARRYSRLLSPSVRKPEEESCGICCLFEALSLAPACGRVKHTLMRQRRTLPASPASPGGAHPPRSL